MKHELKPIKGESFRNLYRTFLFIKCPDMLKSIEDTFEVSEKDDGVFALGYIDHEAGLSFRVIASAHFENEKIIIGKEKSDVMFIFRAGFLQECSYVRFDANEMDYVPYYDYVEQAMSYDKDLEGAVEARDIELLDLFRHPEYPDDIEIYFVGENIEPENMWLRISRVEENALYGKVLDEPAQKIGIHLGDEIDFVLVKQKDGTIGAFHICE